MGLDMYLTATKDVGGSKHCEAEERARFNEILRAIDMATDQVAEQSPHLEVSVCVGYWRKANAIHAWFVREVQHGNDECKRSYVSREQLTKLRDLCSVVIATKDPTPLPPQKGFFFGSTEIDDWYWADLRHTIATINRVLKLPDSLEFHYRASR